MEVPKAQKGIADLTVFFVHLRSARVKAAHKMLKKLTPGVNFINTFQTAFSTVNLQWSYWQTA